jgi:hypothetical protein
VSLPESSNEADWTHEISQEALGAQGPYHGHPLHSNSHAADDGWYHNPDLRQDGGFGDGTAAKFDTARNGAKASLVQRNIRMRRRQNKPPELVTNMQSVRNKYTAQFHQASATPSYRPDLPALLVSSDYAGNNNIYATPTPMNDVSNYLPTPTTSNEDIGCPSTSSDQEAFRYASPIEDMYGWDAELERREASPSRDSMSSTEGLDAFALSYRRANGSKHSLLQRVFRVGSSSSMGKMETAV